MTITKITRAFYATLGALYVVLGIGSMLMPTGWLPPSWVDEFLAEDMQTPSVDHLLQEFGTVVVAVGLTFLWRAMRREWSAQFHWVMTSYFSLDSLIHWVGPDGFIGSWSRGSINTIPFALMLILGLLQNRSANRPVVPGAA